MAQREQQILDDEYKRKRAREQREESGAMGNAGDYATLAEALEANPLPDF